MIKLFELFSKKKSEVDVKLPLRVVFNRFRQVLDSNNRALEIMADMGDKLGGNYIFDINYIKKSYSEFADTVFQSIYNLNTLSQNKYLYLHRIFERINNQVNRILQDKTPLDLNDAVIFYKDISWEMTDEVGGKNAGLAELGNSLNLNVPDGFAITTNAFREFIEYNHIDEKIGELKKRYAKAAICSRKENILPYDDCPDGSFFPEVQKIIDNGKLPDHLEVSLRKALDRLRNNNGKTCFLAVRSSAEREDLEFSFAGQFESVLNVPAEMTTLMDAYKKVLASLYSPEATAYLKRITMEDNPVMAMSVGCVKMVDSMASGVMYTMDPNDIDNDVVIINSNWGLGTTVVEGTVDADRYVVEKNEPYAIRERKIGKKEIMAVTDRDGGIRNVPVPENDRARQCLSDEQIKTLTLQAVLIEHYVKKPQDIEWAFDKSGKLYILQSRPLKISNKSKYTQKDISSRLQNYSVIMEKQGIIARRGIGAGKVFVLDRMESLKDFSQGSVLVAKHDCSQFIKIMPKAAAIITDIGTPTSHMANIAREFQVPTIVNTGIGTKTLRNGQEITVDADDNKIYAGIVKELLQYNITEDINLSDEKEFRILKKILRYMTPLNLIDPLLDNFTPEGCRSFHDIIRFIHEKGIAELVDIDRYKEILQDNIAVKLDAAVPAAIFIIDIGGGLKSKGNNGNGNGNGTAKSASVSASVSTPLSASIDEITSIPFKAIVGGMVHPGAWHLRGGAVGITDFMPNASKTHGFPNMCYPGKNVAVVSREYVNLILRFGYHFNMVDCYCSENIRDNHVYFRFVGSTSGGMKRSRRVELLAAILRELNMRINTKDNLLVARTDNISRSEMETLLNYLGRLTAYTRHLDTLPDDDRTVRHYARNFLEGKYNLA
ncbi:MAG: hypothetical protein HQK89_03890 [Nitrospirae bacterium]|nr:hypothetical protein [Nitrospirota bacterium]